MRNRHKELKRQCSQSFRSYRTVQETLNELIPGFWSLKERQRVLKAPVQLNIARFGNRWLNFNSKLSATKDKLLFYQSLKYPHFGQCKRTSLQAVEKRSYRKKIIIKSLLSNRSIPFARKLGEPFLAQTYLLIPIPIIFCQNDRMLIQSPQKNKKSRAFHRCNRATEYLITVHFPITGASIMRRCNGRFYLRDV